MMEISMKWHVVFCIAPIGFLNESIKSTVIKCMDIRGQHNKILKNPKCTKIKISFMQMV